MKDLIACEEDMINLVQKIDFAKQKVISKEN